MTAYGTLVEVTAFLWEPIARFKVREKAIIFLDQSWLDKEWTPGKPDSLVSEPELQSWDRVAIWI